MCFVWIWEQTAIISLYNINWLVLITDTQCVYCAVRTGSLNTIQFNLSLQFQSSTVRYVIWLCSTYLCNSIHCSCLASVTAVCGPVRWPLPPCVQTHTVAKGAIGKFTLRSGLHIYTRVTAAQVLSYVLPNDTSNSCSHISVMCPHGLLIICWFVRSVEDGST